MVVSWRTIKITAFDGIIAILFALSCAFAVHLGLFCNRWRPVPAGFLRFRGIRGGVTSYTYDLAF